MIRDAFRRLALLACCTAYALGLTLVWLYVDPLAAVASAIIGAVVAVGVTIEEVTGEAKPERQGEAEGYSRREIARLHPDVEE